MRLVISFILILGFSVSFSQQVTPSERVREYVHVRALPASGSDVIDSLWAGEKALLLTDTIPYWYAIRMGNSATGYVSKAWTNLIPSGPAVKDDFYIASWNIKWFGYFSEDKHDYRAMADVVRRFDVLAIQELRGDKYADRMDSLTAELLRRGYNYTYMVSELSGYRNNPDKNKKDYVERFAFLWDADRVRPVRPDSPYYFISRPVINNDFFRQVPVAADFRLLGGGGFDFTLLTTHTVFKKEISYVRASEMQFLHDWMNNRLRDERIKEKDIFIMGDFNANPPGQPAHFNSIMTDTAMYRIVFNEPLAAGGDPRRTTILVRKNVKARDHLAPVYDHLLMSKHTTYAFDTYPISWESGYIGVVEFDQDSIWAGKTRNEVIRAMSDHRPIWIKIAYDLPDKD